MKVQEAVAATLPLPKLAPVRWHLVVLHDRIWLADPPFAPFRPRSLFLFDATRLQMLGMAPHATRGPIAAEELVDFLCKTCANHNIRPGVLEVGDPALLALLAAPLRTLDVDLVPAAVTADQRRLLRETVAAFDARESEQWENNPKFAGVLRQRRQKGLMATPDITPEAVRAFVEAAQRFHLERAWLYLPGPVGVRVGPDAPTPFIVRAWRPDRSPAIVGRWRWGDDPEDLKLCMESVAFYDLSNIPFEDADDFERLGLLTEEGRYPFPLVGAADEGEDPPRPPAASIGWWEAALRAISRAVASTTADPAWTFPEDLQEVVQALTVATAPGPARVIVSCPPSERTTPNVPSDPEPAPSPAPPAPAPAPAPAPPAPVPPAAAVAAVAAVAPAPRESGPPPPAPPPPPPMAAPYPVDSPAGGEGPVAGDRWRQEQAALGVYRQVWKTELIQREALLTHLSEVLLPPEGPAAAAAGAAAGDGGADEGRRAAEDEADRLRSKCALQAQQLRSQGELIEQLQARVTHLEGTDAHLRAELEAAVRRDGREGRQLLSDLTAGLQGTIKALAVTQEEFRRWVEAVGADTAHHRHRHLERLGRSKAETFATLEANIAAAKRRLLTSDGVADSPAADVPPRPAAPTP